MIAVIKSQENFTNAKESAIFYDEEFYYFQKSVLTNIAEKTKFDNKSMLFIKQALAAKNMIKRYRVTGSRQSEFEIDIFVGGKNEKERLSVLAIKREFWDETGGIALYERTGGF